MNQNIPDFVRENFGSITMILHDMDDTELDMEYVRSLLEKYPKYGLGINISIRIKAWTALQWIVNHPEVDYRELDSWSVKDNQKYFEKMKKLYELMLTFKFYENKL